MSAKVKTRRSGPLGVFVLLLLSLVCLIYYAVLGDVEITFAQKTSSLDAQEATRKIKILTDAQATKKNGFIRLSEGEINSLLQTRAGKMEKKGDDSPLHLIKAGVCLNEKEITFVTWHTLSLFGLEFPVVWQRALLPERSANGWSLAMQDMRIGKVRVPRSFWAEPNRLLGSGDAAFQEHKAWLATLPTLMLSKNEMSQKPELRLYTYIPLVKEGAEAEPLPRVQAPSSVSTNSLTANL